MKFLRTAPKGRARPARWKTVSHYFGKPSTQGEAGTSVGLVLFQAKSDTSLVGIGEREGGRLTIHLGRPGVRCAPATSHIESFFTGAFSECAERSGAIEGEINSMARVWWTSPKSGVLKAQARKEIDPAVDARRISFDLNGTLMALLGVSGGKRWWNLSRGQNHGTNQAGRLGDASNAG